MALSKSYKAQWITLQWIAFNYGVILTEDEVIDLFAPYLKSRFRTPQRPRLYRNSYRFGILESNEPGDDPFFDAIYEGPWKDTGLQGYTLAESLGKVQITSVKWNLRKRDKTAVSQSDIDFVRDAIKKVNAVIKTEIPSPSPSGARAKMKKFFEDNKRALERLGWSLADLPTLSSWSFAYTANPYGTLPKWDYDKGRPTTPSLPRPAKKTVAKPDEPIEEKKKGFGGILFAIIAALTALRRG